MKSYTDISQSKKLAEILPLESADMRYAPFGDTHPWVWDEEVKLLENGAIPCWSLSALLGMIDTVKEILYYRVTMLVGKYAGNNWYIELEKIQDERSALLVYSKELINVCYKMVIKLHEQNLL